MSALSNTTADLFLCFVSRLEVKEVTGGRPTEDTENQYRDTVPHENRRLNASISNTHIFGHLSSCERGLRLILTIRLNSRQQAIVRQLFGGRFLNKFCTVTLSVSIPYDVQHSRKKCFDGQCQSVQKV